MNKEIIFDMDGTIVNLYEVPNWLEKIKKKEVSPFNEAKPIYNMEILNSLVRSLLRLGYDIKVVTAYPKQEENKRYRAEIAFAKKKWLERNGFPYVSFCAVPYEEPKSKYANGNASTSILIDDNEMIREEYENAGYQTIDPHKNLLDELAKIFLEE